MIAYRFLLRRYVNSEPIEIPMWFEKETGWLTRSPYKTKKPYAPTIEHVRRMFRTFPREIVFYDLNDRVP